MVNVTRPSVIIDQRASEAGKETSSPSLASVRETMKFSTRCNGGVVADSRDSLASFFGSNIKQGQL